MSSLASEVVSDGPDGRENEVDAFEDVEEKRMSEQPRMMAGQSEQGCNLVTVETKE